MTVVKVEKLSKKIKDKEILRNISLKSTMVNVLP